MFSVLNQDLLVLTLEADEVKRMLRLASDDSSAAVQLQDVLEVNARGSEFRDMRENLHQAPQQERVRP